jgi:HlyD family secretion protein
MNGNLESVPITGEGLVTVKKLLLLLVLIGATLVGVAYRTKLLHPAISEEKFTTMPVEYGQLTEAINANGIVQPRNITAVGSELSGKVIKIFPGVDYNLPVKAGQPLLQLDDRMALRKKEQAEIAVRLAKADVDRAKASEEAAALAVKRQKELQQKDIVQKVEVDKAQMLLRAATAAVQAAQVKIDEAEAALRLANLGLEMTQIGAPRSGVIIEKKVVEGQLIAPPVSGHLFTIADDLKHMEVLAQIAEGDIGRIQVGLPVTFTVYAYSDEVAPFEGKVESVRLMPNHVQGAVFYSAVIGVENRQEVQADGSKNFMLRPGMTATIDIRRRQHSQVWKMPTAATNFELDPAYQSDAAKAKLDSWKSRSDRENWKTVWIVRDQKPWPIFVRLGGTKANGEKGIKDGQYDEVLEWDPDLDSQPDPKNPASYPQVIIAAPPVTKPGIFDRGTGLKIS